MTFDLLYCLSALLLSWSIYFIIFRSFNILYTNNRIANILYFIIITIIGYILFGKYFERPSLITTYIFSSLIIFLYFTIETIYYFTTREMQKRYLQVKVWEIIFQQSYIFILIKIFIYYYAGNIPHPYIVFSIFFGLTHIPLLFFKFLNKLRFLYFTLAFVGGYLFIFLIDKSELFFLSFFIHYCFYLAISFTLKEDFLKQL